ncbi:transmembrane protein, putative (macronuclear) [Tetrahymena thermophila SB210]|uniref:Transmembrane protein, putative n=1 Tax=Tetrahymena thermophila (strain SB210) TaxID=312017 RepID=I7MF49_TETTS|nr:transmembrane protein, putative [Tetrahymena thermophila SB210]EAR98483.2 transmembrane protein, putative [Tetrahymena thermophila SB210]|eukprot:XP_001018728.2 transmembrane protein, putative [Tetrahymena thermophila SB210]
MENNSEQQEEILYFVKESIELENKQIQEVIIGHFYIIFVSFSGSIYIFEKGEEFQDENDDEFMNTTDSSNEENQIIKSKQQKQPEKKKNLFLDFDHKLELPFAKSLILNDKQKEIRLLIVAKNGEMCNLFINIESFKIINYQLTKMSLEILNKEDKIIKSAKIIDYNKLLIVYPFQIYLIQNVINQKTVSLANMIFECDAEIDQLDYFDNILCISTKKRYYSLNLATQQAVKLGSAKSIEMQDFLGITFFPRNQNESVMAARPNGNMWKAQVSSGKVLTTLQFTDEDNNKLNFGRLYAFNRYILSINGQNRLYIIDMNDKQLMTKVFPNCSQLTFLYNHYNQSEKTDSNNKNEFQERSFYLYYMENGRNLVIERCSIKNIQKSFEASLSKNSVGQCAELFEKYEALQNIKNLKSLLKANLQNPLDLRFQFSSSFKDCVKKIEEEQFQWNREKEIEQNELKENIESIKNSKNKQQISSKIHKSTEQNITKIIDVDNLPFLMSNKIIKIISLGDSYSSCQICHLTNKQNTQKYIKNSNFGDFEFKKKQSSVLKKQHILPNDNQNKQTKYGNNQQTPNELLLAHMVQKILPGNNLEQQSEQKLISNNEFIQNINQLICQKVYQCQIEVFKTQLLDNLRNRNPNQKNFINEKLKSLSLIQILMLVSRNFTKQFISTQNKFQQNLQLNYQISYTIQCKSIVDMFNDTNIYLQLSKIIITNLLIYYIGESFASQIINQNEDNLLEFDQIAAILNQLSVN